MATKGYIKYRSNYKYQLAEAYELDTAIHPKADINTEFIKLSSSGKLLVKKGYAWDGPSGPLKDTSKNLRASLVHDAMYQLLRHKHLTARTHREPADHLFKVMCKEDGVSNFLASKYYKVLRRFGRPSASPSNKKKTHRAPK